MTAKMPVLFIGHGSPLNIVLDNTFTRSLARWATTLPRPRAIMVISAHWLTSGTFVACTNKPATLYDFYGFPDELYEMDYPSPGAPDDARAVAAMVHRAPVSCDTNWGLDHASWSVLKHMYPAADIPVFEMSLDYSFNDWHPKPLQYHYDLAAELGGLRERGVLIVGSGNIVHNLTLLDFEDMDAKVYPWAKEFDEEVKDHLTRRNHSALVRYRKNGKVADLAVPTLDHYLPMIYAIALQEKGEPLTFIHEGFQNASISMRCFQIG
jgi:4,5-DOPA dioxygenase extradiol